MGLRLHLAGWSYVLRLDFRCQIALIVKIPIMGADIVLRFCHSEGAVFRKAVKSNFGEELHQIKFLSLVAQKTP